MSERGFYNVIHPLYPTDVFPIAMVWNTKYFPTPYEILNQVHQYARKYPSIIGTRETVMAGKNTFSKDFKFINRTLTVAEDDSFIKWFQGKDRQADNAIEQAFADEYKVSLSYDEKNNCFIASMVSKAEKSLNTNKCLMARSDSWLEAIAMVVYKHHVIFNQGAWESEENGRQRG